MTWDEKALELIMQMKNMEPRDDGYCIYFNGYRWSDVTPLIRFHIKSDGSIYKWVRRNLGHRSQPAKRSERDGAWREVTSPRMKKVVMMSVWPEYQA